MNPDVALLYILLQVAVVVLYAVTTPWGGGENVSQIGQDPPSSDGGGGGK